MERLTPTTEEITEIITEELHRQIRKELEREEMSKRISRYMPESKYYDGWKRRKMREHLGR